MPRGALVFCLALCGLLGLPRLAVPQALVDQMPLADLQKCGALALDMTTGQQDLAATDRALKAEGAAIRAESAAVDAARRTVPLRDPAAVKRFNARVSALDIRVAAYSGEIARRNTRGQTANDVTQQFNVLCAHRPYDPEMLASLPPAQAQAMSRGATTVAIPSIDNAPDTPPPPPPPAGPDPVVIGGPPQPGRRPLPAVSRAPPTCATPPRRATPRRNISWVRPWSPAARSAATTPRGCPG
jgi:hypothetical protein